MEVDGLLTMEKIPGLKLDADWVMLSACNTAADAGAGADAKLTRAETLRQSMLDLLDGPGQLDSPTETIAFS